MRACHGSSSGPGSVLVVFRIVALLENATVFVFVDSVGQIDDGVAMVKIIDVSLEIVEVEGPHPIGRLATTEACYRLPIRRVIVHSEFDKLANDLHKVDIARMVMMLLRNGVV